MTLDDLRKENKKPVVIVNQEGFLIYINQPFMDIFHWQEHQLIGQPLTVVIPPNLHDAHNLGFSRFLIMQQPTLLNKALNLEVMTGNGLRVNSTHCIIAETSNGKWTFGATIVPITA